MRTREKVSPEKLRGGFYSPDVLVDMCFDRAQSLLAGRGNLRLLEPAAGDGAFVRGLARHAIADQVSWVQAVEVLPAEAQKCRDSLVSAGIPGEVDAANVLRWQSSHEEQYDIAVSNPPYVRYQFVSAEDRQRSARIAAELGIIGSAVSNLWISVFLVTLSRLRNGGVFSAILPSEFLTGVSAGRVRTWLLTATVDLQIDLFKPGSFPSVLQEVLILTGRRVTDHSNAGRSIRFRDHNGGTHEWNHEIDPNAKTWTGYLLSPDQVHAVALAGGLDEVHPLGDLARFSVATVTGANSFFCVDSQTLDRYDLTPWALPLLPRSRNAPGMDFDSCDHDVLVREGIVAWLLSFSADKPSPLASTGARRYIAQGEGQRLHERFKCRIREPWFRVPVVPPGQLMMSKRSNTFPRVMLNSANVVTTDTIYRGRLRGGSIMSAEDLAAAFHNSLTLLSVEIEGRSFGGGVLELVPSEIASLALPSAPGVRERLSELDRHSRAGDEGALIEATDAEVARRVPQLGEIMPTLREAREELATRRLQRTGADFYSV